MASESPKLADLLERVEKATGPDRGAWPSKDPALKH